ncbi:MAG TPA: sulfur carrier protein ThiS [Acidimicrobiales bacterium]|nr:sulfur carrier protein ThiS [Acidimicrobiales bacterium]
MLNAVGRGVLAVVVNGAHCAVPGGTTVADVVTQHCSSAEGIAVARNREVVPRAVWASTVLTGGDRIEIVTAAAGG